MPNAKPEVKRKAGGGCGREKKDRTEYRAERVARRRRVPLDRIVNPSDDARGQFAFVGTCVRAQDFGDGKLVGSPFFAGTALRKVCVDCCIIGGRKFAVQIVDNAFGTRMRLVHEDDFM
jgi:hypothetical protein